ncbi:MAG: Hsp70 family protein, partial [Gemmataceae bacterium]|nr:Hsp70 family protein [Gemmataceae bacterium]
MNFFFEYLKQAAQTQSINGPLRALGIDLGTTNSTAAEIVWSPDQAERSQPRCLPIDQLTEEGRYTHVLLPTIVARIKDRVLIGEGAKRLRARSSERGLERGRDLFWECKNDMGLQRTYHRGTSGFRSAREIGGHVLRFMMDSVRAEDDRPLDRVVVTVPASFQAAQRHDTMEAARLAGLELVGGDLVDEPVAAFLDYGFTHGLDELGMPGDRRNLLVFDFGGGTCDVAVFRVEFPRQGERLQITSLAVSRYHRLGGGDIEYGWRRRTRGRSSLGQRRLSRSPARAQRVFQTKPTAVRCVQRSEPYGRSRTTHPRMDFSSASVCGWLTRSAQSSGSATGQSVRIARAAFSSPGELASGGREPPEGT